MSVICKIYIAIYSLLYSRCLSKLSSPKTTRKVEQKRSIACLNSWPGSIGGSEAGPIPIVIMMSGNYGVSIRNQKRAMTVDGRLEVKNICPSTTQTWNIFQKSILRITMMIRYLTLRLISSQCQDINLARIQSPKTKCKITKKILMIRRQSKIVAATHSHKDNFPNTIASSRKWTTRIEKRFNPPKELCLQEAPKWAIAKAHFYLPRVKGKTLQLIWGAAKQLPKVCSIGFRVKRNTKRNRWSPNRVNVRKIQMSSSFTLSKSALITIVKFPRRATQSVWGSKTSSRIKSHWSVLLNQQFSKNLHRWQRAAKTLSSVFQPQVNQTKSRRNLTNIRSSNH